MMIIRLTISAFEARGPKQTLQIYRHQQQNTCLQKETEQERKGHREGSPVRPQGSGLGEKLRRPSDEHFVNPRPTKRSLQSLTAGRIML